ncbi:MAG: CHASE2 domain-containing protein [Symploca sp. SIO3C6]|nr:CHASE2 domain-containing protein [Symploca sp. SIO3C6]
MSYYQVGGSLNNDHPYYIRRQADVDLYDALSKGEFCYIFNARQMGKSSLMVQMFHQLEQEGVCCAAVDMSRIGTENLTPEQWYKGLVVELWQGFDLLSKVNLKAWWRERLDISPVQRLGRFIEEIILTEVGIQQGRFPAKLAIFLDEIDSIRSLDFSVNDFFALIRSCYNQRSLNQAYQRLTFVLLGVATPLDLMSDPLRTPFNIGQAIALDGFQLAQAQTLAQGLEGYVDNPQLAIKEILSWTGGQPFLTQKLCQLLIKHSVFSSHQKQSLEVSSPYSRENDSQLITINDEQLTINESEESPYSVDEKEQIAQIVRKFIIQDWQLQDEPEHLRTIHDRLLAKPQKTCRVLGIYQQILNYRTQELQESERDGNLSLTPTPVLADESREQVELLLSGLVVNRQGQLVVKNPIYRAVFNADWVSQQLANLRPYAQYFDAWIANGKQDESHLLQGQVLQDALTWALGKSLSDEDYQFLGASQELAKRQAQSALEAVEQASELLARARQQANQEVQRRRIGWGWIPGMALSITAPILLLRLVGLLQGWEWDVLDQFFRWRPLELPEKRIILITIDEQDITEVGHWPIPDRLLAQVITKLKAQEARTIGLDIYRDLPVEPGHANLVSLFQSTPNLFGIEKVVGNRVAPPPALKQLGQVGFTDQVEDIDGKVRRGLLSVISDQELHYSLAVKMALHYLAAEGIALEELDSYGQRLRLGKAVFERFEGNHGGYVRAQSGGYQILLNFRSPEACCLSFSLKEVLNNQIPSQSVRERLVLIGTTAESIRDNFYTPYSGGLFGSPEAITGVTLNANIASQIISAALDGRPLIRVWSNPMEWLWVLAWAGVGAIVSWRLKSAIALVLSMVIISSGLVGGCFLAFVQGWWLPIVPSLLGLWGAVVAVQIVTNKQMEQLRFRQTLVLLLEMQRQYPTTVQIALEYLKLSEMKENQALIEKQLEMGRWGDGERGR